MLRDLLQYCPITLRSRLPFFWTHREAVLQATNTHNRGHSKEVVVPIAEHAQEVTMALLH